MKKAQIVDSVLIAGVLILAVFITFFVGFSGRLVLGFLALFLFSLAFLNTTLALVLLIFSMLLSPEFALGGIQGREIVIRIDDILIAIVFLGWMARMAVHKELGLLRITILNKPILIYLSVCVLATAFGVARGLVSAKYSFFYLLKYLEYFVIFFMVSNNVRDKKQIKVFITFMLLTCFLVSIYALWSHFHLGLRATAPFEGSQGEANTLAGYLMLMMGVILGLILNLKSVPGRIALAVLLGFIVVPLVYTFSRSGWLATAAMVVAFIIFSPRGKVYLIVALALVFYFGPKIVPRIAVERAKSTFVGPGTYTIMGHQITLDESSAARVRSLALSFDIWKQHPVLGKGVPGGGVLFDVQYARILREVGLLGFLAFVWMIVRLFKAGFVCLKSETTDDFGRGLSLGFICSLCGLLIMGFGAEVFIIIRIMEPFWFLAAIVVVYPELAALEVVPQETLGLQKNKEINYGRSF